jgi:hypothetical protein
MTEKLLMKITHAELGFGGYQDAEFGVRFNFSGRYSSIGTFKGHWAGKRSEYAKWTEQDRDKVFSDTMHWVSELLVQAKKSSLSELVGVPVEVEIENNTFKSFRILTEVI